MKISSSGAFIQWPYKNASPDIGFTRVTDPDGAEIYISTKLIVYLYELIKFDFEHRGVDLEKLFPRE